MALDINGYNATFRAFTNFAQRRVDANDENAIADAHVQKPLVGRKTLAITQSLTPWTLVATVVGIAFPPAYFSMFSRKVQEDPLPTSF